MDDSSRTKQQANCLLTDHAEDILAYGSQLAEDLQYLDGSVAVCDLVQRCVLQYQSKNYKVLRMCVRVEKIKLS